MYDRSGRLADYPGDLVSFIKVWFYTQVSIHPFFSSMFLWKCYQLKWDADCSFTWTVFLGSALPPRSVLIIDRFSLKLDVLAFAGLTNSGSDIGHLTRISLTMRPQQGVLTGMAVHYWRLYYRGILGARPWCNRLSRCSYFALTTLTLQSTTVYYGI